MRKNPTNAEKVLWKRLRKRQIKERKILRQYPIYFDWQGKSRFFIADFYCAEKKLIIEVDGIIHNYNIEYDRIREEILELLGYNVVRIKNENVLHNLEEVLDKLNVILMYLQITSTNYTNKGVQEIYN